MIRTVSPLIVALLLMVAGCASPPPPSESLLHADDPAVQAAYKAQMEHAVDIVQATPNYKRIPLDTEEEQAWFTALTFLYWDNQITREEFIQEGLSRFPGYKASLELVADALKD